MPGDTRPHVARKAKKARKAGSVEALRLKLWNAILQAESVIETASERGNADGILRGVHAVTQASSTYARIVEAGELEARLAELEAAFAARDGAGPLRKVA